MFRHTKLESRVEQKLCHLAVRLRLAKSITNRLKLF